MLGPWHSVRVAGDSILEIGRKRGRPGRRKRQMRDRPGSGRRIPRHRSRPRRSVSTATAPAVGRRSPRTVPRHAPPAPPARGHRRSGPRGVPWRPALPRTGAERTRRCSSTPTAAPFQVSARPDRPRPHRHPRRTGARPSAGARAKPSPCSASRSGFARDRKSSRPSGKPVARPAATPTAVRMSTSLQTGAPSSHRSCCSRRRPGRGREAVVESGSLVSAKRTSSSSRFSADGSPTRASEARTGAVGARTSATRSSTDIGSRESSRGRAAARRAPIPRHV